MADDFNQLMRPGIQAASPPPNPLGPTPSLADAWSYNTQAAQDWVNQQRAISEQQGLWGPQGITPAGVVNAAQQTAQGIMMGTTAPGDAVPGFTAYHGSPHSFDAFDASKIGTGEGAQAYGHGLYFAGNEGVARGYRDALSDQNLVWPNDVAPQLHAALPDHLRQQYRSDIEAGRDPTDWLNNVADGAQRHAEWVQSGGKPSVNYGPDGGFALADTAKQLADQPLPTAKSAGHMYEVQVNADPAHFLDWDKPLSEQSQHVQDAWQNVVAADKADVIAKRQALHDQAGPNSPFGPGNPVDAYSGPRDPLSLIQSDPVRATQLLQQAGIPGIRYADANSRAMLQQNAEARARFNQVVASGAKPGSEAYDGAAFFVKQTTPTSNHVIFDANTIDILRKYGIAGLMAGGGAAAAGTQQPPSQ